MSVRLREVNKQNWYQVTQLKVRDDQEKFVSDNTFSLAQAAYNPSFVPLVVENDEGKLVGFFMYGYEADMDRCWVVRLMIDQRYQRQGYGRATMVEGLRIMRERLGDRDIYISYEHDNSIARQFYHSLGFQELDIENGEMIYDIYYNEQVAVLHPGLLANGLLKR